MSSWRQRAALPGWLGMACLLLAAWLPAAAQAVSPQEVKPYAEVFSLQARAETRAQLVLEWTIADGYYLYNNQFLGFTSPTPGVTLGQPVLPPGKRSFDALLGEEVEKYHGQMVVTLPMVAVPADVDELVIETRSQGCLEDVLCYPPTTQQVSVNLPAGAAEPGVTGAPSGLDELLSGLGATPSATGAPLQDKPPALAPDEAFVYEAVGLDEDTVLVRFTAQPGYYLYVDKFAFEVIGASDVQVRRVELPTGTIKDDPEFGPVPVIYDQVEIPVHLSRPAGPDREIVLAADWQGCRDGDICYPPQRGQLTAELAAASVAVSGPALVSSAAPEVPIGEQGRLARLLLERPVAAMVAFFIAGILLAFTPCVFPMVPILSGIIAGEGENVTTGRAFWLSLVYVLAMALTYTVAGVLAGLFGQNLQAVFQDPWVISFFVLVFIVLALSMFGFFELQLPSSWQTRLAERSNRQGGGKLGGVAVMGLLSALIVGPCVAPPLAAALIVIGSSGDALLGGAALFALSMGMGVPLLVFGVTAGRYLPRAGRWMGAIKAVFGVGLLALAIWLLERILPGAVIMALWGVLAIGCGVFLGALERVPEGAGGWPRAWKALGLVLLLVGAAEIVGSVSGGDNWMRPLQHLGASARHSGEGASRSAHIEPERIKSLDDLAAAVARANAAGKPAMLDYYADWCVECLRMERNTFPKPEIQALFERIHPLQADVTEHDKVDQALMAEYDVIGPPAILFFDRAGREMPAYRLVGYFDADSFASHLEKVLEAQ
ncbi:protein-disulfide reductase DsbD [Marinihelvus fidelis]|uniref:Thiol:disulfide interchange protein DsbD n=1 Tax=Marinihelvus fidelis TaxID=2613842 RepID=A0A5N0TA11_9GAMM|nr:protein-disulfide reductase DsbD [Marinihelvus fidelis]KAA9131611.1 protein-disulfide reductase DsbD [Marinihelvus fidelis]